MHHGIVLHEILHAAGFWHEQSRMDRDQHVKILWHNIQMGKGDQFGRLENINCIFLISARYQGRTSQPYDLGSIMHYGSTAFSANGRPTIQALAGVLVLGTLLFPLTILKRKAQVVAMLWVSEEACQTQMWPNLGCFTAVRRWRRRRRRGVGWVQLRGYQASLLWH